MQGNEKQKETMLEMDFQKIKETSDINEVNQLLEKGWKVIETQNRNGIEYYIIGLLKEKRLVDKKNGAGTAKISGKAVAAAALGIIIIAVIIPTAKPSLFGFIYGELESGILLIGIFLTLYGFSKILPAVETFKGNMQGKK